MNLRSAFNRSVGGAVFLFPGKFDLFEIVQHGVRNRGLFHIRHLLNVEVKLRSGGHADVIRLFRDFVRDVFQRDVGKSLECFGKRILRGAVVFGNNGRTVVKSLGRFKTFRKPAGECHRVLEHLVQIGVSHNPAGNPRRHIGNGGFALVARLIRLLQHPPLKLEFHADLTGGDLPDQYEIAVAHHPVADA